MYGKFDLQVSGFRGWNNQLVVYDTRTNTWSNPQCKVSRGYDVGCYTFCNYKSWFEAFSSISV